MYLILHNFFHIYFCYSFILMVSLEKGYEGKEIMREERLTIKAPPLLVFPLGSG